MPDKTTRLVPMTQTQRVVDTITWHAGYDLGMSTAKAKGLEAEAADRLAMQIADQTVADTQGSGRVGDMAAIMRGGETAKFLTTFYTYFSTTYNLMAESAGRAVHKGEVGQLFGNTIALWAVPAVLTDLIGRALRGDQSQYGWKDLARSEISYGLGMLVGFRELSGVVQGHSYSGPGSLGLIGRAGELIVQTQQALGDKRGVAHGLDAGLLKAAAGTALSPFGLPVVEMGRIIDAWQIAAEKGDFAAALRAALFGKPRK